MSDDPHAELRKWRGLSALTARSIPELMALQDGVQMVEFREAVGGGMISIKPDRIARLEERGGDRAAVFFTPGGDDRPVLLDLGRDKVRRRLREAGWDR